MSDLNAAAEAALVEAVAIFPPNQATPYDPDVIDAVTALVLGSLRPHVEAAVKRAYNGAVTA